MFSHGRDLSFIGHPTASTRASDARVFFMSRSKRNEMDVFISYSSTDRSVKNEDGRDVITLIQQAFKENEISYWSDEESNNAGESSASTISRHISEAKILLFVSSADSNASRWICGEIATAHSYEKRIIPFKIDPTPYDPSITIYLAALDTIEYNNNPVKALRRLIKSVKLYLAELQAEELQREEERRRKEELERAKVEHERRRAEKEKILVQISIERAEVEERIRTLDARIDDLLEEKKSLLSDLTSVKTKIAALQNEAGL